MKTDEEIKQFIDSREVITQRELRKFIFGYCTGKKTGTFGKWWDYVLQTKDWKKLKEYRDERELNCQADKRIKYFELYKQDVRLRELGSSDSCKLLKRVYSLDYNRGTIRKYHKLIELNNVTNK